jgi:protein dithiol:quinone oxidoreductase
MDQKIKMSFYTYLFGQRKQKATVLRLNYAGLTIFCAAGVVFALYMQHYESVEPCPLCIFQRIGVIACGALSILAALLPLVRLNWFWPSLIGLAAIGGAGVSIRHIQIQQSLTTTQELSCGAGLDFMVQTHSLPDVISSVLSGHGDCTVIDWQLGFLTMPMLALAGFVMIFCWAVFIGLGHKRHTGT